MRRPISRWSAKDARTGDGADLLIDAGLVWDSKTALQRARAFSDYGIYWLEEPLRPTTTTATASWPRPPTSDRGR